MKIKLKHTYVVPHEGRTPKSKRSKNFLGRRCGIQGLKSFLPLAFHKQDRFWMPASSAQKFRYAFNFSGRLRASTTGLVTTICFLLTACASDIVRDSNATIKNNPEYGYVAFSTVCKNTPKVFMFYDDKGLNFMRTFTQGGSTTNVKITCTNTPQYFLLELPRGKYAIKGFGTTDVPDKAFSTMDFTVLSQQVVYLGRFNVIANPDKAFFSGLNYGFLKADVVDEHKTDLAWLAQNYKNISPASYIVMLPKPDGTTSGFVREMLEVR